MIIKTIDEIRTYLAGVHQAIKENRYSISMNPKRQANKQLFRDYVIDEQKAKLILLSLTEYDFCEVLMNEHKGFEHEELYVFGKDVALLQRFGSEIEMVSLYIKFNQLENNYVVVISFHQQAYPLQYVFT